MILDVLNKAGLTLLPTRVRNSVANTVGNSVHNTVTNSNGVSANTKSVSIAVNIMGHACVSDYLENSNCWLHCCEHVLAVV